MTCLQEENFKLLKHQISHILSLLCCKWSGVTFLSLHILLQTTVGKDHGGGG